MKNYKIYLVLSEVTIHEKKQSNTLSCDSILCNPYNGVGKNESKKVHVTFYIVARQIAVSNGK